MKQKYGVPGPVLVGFWGLETDFGKVMGELYKASTGVKAVEVAYRSATDSLNDFASGAVDYGMKDPVFSIVQEREGRLFHYRTEFQRDRDRIVHSKPFRRLKGKTQVFIDPDGDHYRTRMTHTLETTAIARGVARGLQLNEDLTEVIGLGHDVIAREIYVKEVGPVTARENPDVALVGDRKSVV